MTHYIAVIGISDPNTRKQVFWSEHFLPPPPHVAHVKRNN